MSRRRLAGADNEPLRQQNSTITGRVSPLSAVFQCMLENIHVEGMPGIAAGLVVPKD